jgi:hypothetical protein
MLTAHLLGWIASDCNQAGFTDDASRFITDWYSTQGMNCGFHDGWIARESMER